MDNSIDVTYGVEIKYAPKDRWRTIYALNFSSYADLQKWRQINKNRYDETVSFRAVKRTVITTYESLGAL